jgi:two-component system, cell cycle sensor histidine kinase and response regulator CckA
MAQPHILVVEDENIIALDIQRRLKTLGYAVLAIASSGEEALQRSVAVHPDLVLMDIVLKGDMDGIDLAERFVMLDVPVVYLTAYADEKTLQRAKATRPFGYLLKPFTDSQLQTTIEIALHKHRTDRQTAQAWLTTKKLEAVGTLAGGIAHDFNNLLTAILGHQALAKLYVRPQEPGFVHLAAAEKAAQQAADVTQQLLTFAKGGAPVKQLMGLPPFLREAIHGALADSNVQYDFVLAEELWPVEADRNQIKQVIYQLARNAVQAMPQGGRLKVQAVNVPPGDVPLLHTRGPYIRISITDQGSGIAAEHLEKIFDPYFTTKVHSSGLGLTTAHTIIQRHAGHMTVDSSLGQGTTVHVYLPAAPDAKLPRPVVTAPPMADQGKVLVMDDEEVIRKVVTLMLKQLGYSVESARDGDEAIALYRRAKAAGQPFTVVLMDLIIAAGMGGRETIARLRAFDPEIKAIVSSGYSNDLVMANFQHYGFSGVLAKPYQLAELRAVLDDVIGSRHAAGQRWR